jgi:hypothetical protein
MPKHTLQYFISLLLLLASTGEIYAQALSKQLSKEDRSKLADIAIQWHELQLIDSTTNFLRIDSNEFVLQIAESVYQLKSYDEVQEKVSRNKYALVSSGILLIADSARNLSILELLKILESSDIHNCKLLYTNEFMASPASPLTAQAPQLLKEESRLADSTAIRFIVSKDSIICKISNTEYKIGSVEDIGQFIDSHLSTLKSSSVIVLVKQTTAIDACKPLMKALSDRGISKILLSRE